MRSPSRLRIATHADAVLVLCIHFAAGSARRRQVHCVAPPEWVAFES